MGCQPLETHYIPFHGQTIVYRPLQRLAFVANDVLVAYLKSRNGQSGPNPENEIEDFLSAIGFSQEGEVELASDGADRIALPTMAVLLLTDRCNLSCTYCYADGGRRSSDDMPVATAIHLIDAAHANALSAGDDRFALSFHGGGEPTLNWETLVSAVTHAEAKALPCDISITSNGMWSEDQTAYLIEHCSHVSLSVDGIQAVQDAQRPRTDGGGSFPQAMRSIRALDRSGTDYGIRMTVTADSIDSLAASCEFLCHESNISSLQIELTYTQERGVYSAQQQSTVERFAYAFLDAFDIAAARNVFAYYSGARPWVIARSFCQASTHSLIATPAGDLVACFEIANRHHPFFSDFVVGRVGPGGVALDSGAMATVQERDSSRRNGCGDCFCYWHCCGDCATRVMGMGEEQARRCWLNRTVTSEMLGRYIAASDGVWTGDSRCVFPRAVGQCC